MDSDVSLRGDKGGRGVGHLDLSRSRRYWITIGLHRRSKECN